VDPTALEPPIEIRAVAPADLDLICHHREEMFRDAGSDEQSLAVMTENFRPWLEPRLADGSYFGFILIATGEPAGGVGLMLIDWPPHPLHPAQDRRGYVLNLFVEPEHRRKGLARRLMRLAEDELSRRGVSLLVLHATEKGRPLYSDLGWVAGAAEMLKQAQAADRVPDELRAPISD
jgi:ribosomal protein S18 acetylase RimI-like enzyme